jgi:hypothetical protein
MTFLPWCDEIPNTDTTNEKICLLRDFTKSCPKNWNYSMNGFYECVKNKI